MSNPYRIEAPALISFSGGRTSGFMLQHILDAFGGRLPEGIVAVFANTGKEMTETLDFVPDCGKRWGVNIVWLEYNPGLPKMFEIVTHANSTRRMIRFTRASSSRARQIGD
jgi:3'-phosphoadenosine 5'-phosphosulfate sulfotransferase (PAPS reductase)/FAD synthetase